MLGKKSVDDILNFFLGFPRERSFTFNANCLFLCSADNFMILICTRSNKKDLY